MTTPDPSRAAFEQWYSTAGENSRSVERQEDGRYIYVPTEVCWVTWQAAMDHKGADFWQPIATAPLDGTRVLLASIQDRPFAGTGNWVARQRMWTWAYPLLEPTHWAPLPAAPKQEGNT